MKTVIPLIILTILTSNLMAQWIGSPGNIYYNSGNVGIGTMAPGYKTVISNNGAAGMEIDPTGGQFSEGVGMQTYNRVTSTYTPFLIYSSKLVLNGGNVGIGTTNPDMKLSIQASDQFIARFSSAGTQSISGLRIGSSSSYADLVTLSTGFGIGSGINSANLPLNTQNPNFVYFFLSNTGNIGIGTTTPGYKTVISNNGAAGIEIDPTGIQFPQGVGLQTYNRSTSTYMPFQIYSSKLVLDGGNVLIGKATQVNSAYKLDVNGSMRSNEVVVNVTGADFVFQDNYNLKTLNEVEKFIKDNKHLPDIEAAKEMEEKGLELGKMDMKLLQKIEELTLYMIDFKKEMDKMREENQKLKEKITKLEKHL